MPVLLAWSVADAENIAPSTTSAETEKSIVRIKNESIWVFLIFFITATVSSDLFFVNKTATVSQHMSHKQFKLSYKTMYERYTFWHISQQNKHTNFIDEYPTDLQ